MLDWCPYVGRQGWKLVSSAGHMETWIFDLTLVNRCWWVVGGGRSCGSSLLIASVFSKVKSEQVRQHLLSEDGGGGGVGIRREKQQCEILPRRMGEQVSGSPTCLEDYLQDLLKDRLRGKHPSQ